PELRGQAAYEQELPVLVSRGQADAPLQGICLNLDAGCVELHYHAEALTSDQAQLLAQRLELILSEALEGGSQLWTTLSIIPESERNLLVEEWQRTKAEYASEKCIHQYFEEQARRSPEATAL